MSFDNQLLNVISTLVQNHSKQSDSQTNQTGLSSINLQSNRQLVNSDQQQDLHNNRFLPYNVYRPNTETNYQKHNREMHRAMENLSV